MGSKLPFQKPENLGKRLLILCVSIILMGFSTSLLRPIELGSDPYTTLNMGIELATPISFGTAELLVNGIMLVFVLIADRKQIGIGTVVNMFFLGYVSDFFFWIWGMVLPADFFASMVVRYALLVPALVIFVISCAGYMGTALGVSAYDAIPIWMEKKIPRVHGRIIRICWDWFYIILGILMGAPAGIITVLMAFMLGPTISAVRDWFRKIGLV